ncbi:M20/M25/M40 family metallo-hydrolase [Pseudofrankia inefficax]|uniref:Peptidase M20 n=1 Tax=Pseudofrankia inefficax (strain DSM 45817 / CECT 9037 / DDB 130130 / EuI1c) TaxID=298654 RepID=E3IU07_PSEI1|nr:M20/M25/M40 family metallo-hydrolase [Pseudofrankia inefficax]ADP81200.1 peptidase M20 [Pseudofrankia inefficax]
MNPSPPGGAPTAAQEAVEICHRLLRIDTSNDGEHPERPAAEYVAALLAEVGLEPFVTEAAPGRTSVVARLAGRDRDSPALLVHAHLDTVPADRAAWSVDPYGGELRDGCLWGRGAVDMKDMVAMTLAVVRAYARSGRRPARDVVLAFVADEEAGGTYGARYLVENHRALFADCSDAIGEIGGFSSALPDGRRLYPIQVAEKGVHWFRLTAESAGSGPNPAVAVCEAVARIAAHPFPAGLPASAEAFLGAVGAATGRYFGAGTAADLRELHGLFPTFAPMALQLRDTVAPTTLTSDVRDEPGPARVERASATIDGRYLPGRADEFAATVTELAGPGVTVEVLQHSPAVETEPAGAFYDAMRASLRAVDPGAVAVPYLQSAGTDAKWFTQAGIRCYGFSPLALPPGFDFAAMFHGVDERVPVAALAFGVEVLDHLLGSPARPRVGVEGAPAGHGLVIPDAWALGCR